MVLRNYKFKFKRWLSPIRIVLALNKKKKEKCLENQTKTIATN